MDTMSCEKALHKMDADEARRVIYGRLDTRTVSSSQMKTSLDMVQKALDSLEDSDDADRVRWFREQEHRLLVALRTSSPDREATARQATRRYSRPAFHGGVTGTEVPPITDAQVRFILNMDEEIRRRRNEEPLTEQQLEERETSVRRLDRSVASTLIDSLKVTLDGLRQHADYTATSTAPVVPIGFYHLNGKVYRVKQNQAGTRRYAVEVGGDYAPGIIRRLTTDMAVTLEHAQEYGRATGNCMCCGRTLTKAESIEAGIGPVCKNRYFG